MSDERTLTDRYLYHLRDTLILLGGMSHGLDLWFIDLLLAPSGIQESDVKGLQNFNAKMINATKDKLVNINRVQVEGTS